MALSLIVKDNEIELVISGCHNGECKEKSNGHVVCGEIEILTENFHPYLASPLTRLFLHIQFGRKYKIDEIISKFDKYFENGQHNDENAIPFLKKTILEELETDNSWKICTKCKTEYDNKTRKFEKIYYIIPSENLCIMHKK
jgi:hypothetical protein